MMEDKYWQELGKEWREHIPPFDVEHQQILEAAQRDSRTVLWLGILSLATATIVMAALIFLAFLHRTLLTYSFAIISMSAFLPICSYLAFHWSSLRPEALDSASMLDTLLRRQSAKRNLMEFLLVLLTVETVIATVFWFAGSGFRAWHAGLALSGFGVFLACLVWWQRKRTERLMQTLQELRATLMD